MRFGKIADATLVAGLALAPVMPGLAQSYPDKPVTMVVPFGAGGSTDITARQVARAMHDAFGRSVVILNRPGADSSPAIGGTSSSAGAGRAPTSTLRDAR